MQIPDFMELMYACKSAYRLGRGSVGSRLVRRPCPLSRSIRGKNTKRVLAAIQKETDYRVPLWDCAARKMLLASFDIGLRDQQDEEEYLRLPPLST